MIGFHIKGLWKQKTRSKNKGTEGWFPSCKMKKPWSFCCSGLDNIARPGFDAGAPQLGSPLLLSPFRDVGDAVPVSLWVSCLELSRPAPYRGWNTFGARLTCLTGGSEPNESLVLFFFLYSCLQGLWMELGMTCSQCLPCLSAISHRRWTAPCFTFGPFWTSFLDSYFPLPFGESWSCCLGQADLQFPFHAGTRELPKLIRGECWHVDVCVLVKGGALGKPFACLLQIWCFTMAGTASTAAETYFKRKVCTKLKATSVCGQKEVVKTNWKEIFWFNTSGNILTIRKGKFLWLLGKILWLQCERILNPGQTLM